MKSTFVEALDGLGKKIGLELSLSSEDNVALSADDVEIGLQFLSGPEEVHLHSIIGAAPDEPGEAFFQVLLSANHNGSGTAGGAIGFDTETGLVTLNKRIPSSWLNTGRLETLIEEFIDLTALWQQNFTELTAAALEIDHTNRPAEGSDNSADDWVRI